MSISDKYHKYKTKYFFNKQKGGLNYERCCQNDGIYIIAAHGKSLEPEEGFLVPIGVNIITITKLDGNPIITSRGDPIQEELSRFYESGNYLFTNEDGSTRLTPNGHLLQDKLNNGLKLTGNNRIYFKNHLSWPRQILLSHNKDNRRFIQYLTKHSQSPGFKDGYRQLAYYFPDGDKNLRIYKEVQIISYHSAPTKKIQLDSLQLRNDLGKMGYLGGAATPYRQVLCSIQDKGGNMLHNIPADKLALNEEVRDATKYNNTSISFNPSTGLVNECNIKCIRSSASRCCQQNKSLVTTLDRIIMVEGHGSYIVIACRGTGHLKEPGPELLRQRSSEN